MTLPALHTLPEAAALLRLTPRVLTDWLRENPSDRAGVPRFGALLTFLFGTGCRLSEALRLRWDEVDLRAATALIRETKNGRPRVAHLPPVVVAALGNLPQTGTVFRMTKCGRIYTWLDETARRAGVAIPDGVAFHVCRHTYGSMMRRYGGLDTSGLVATGAWDSHEGARVYEHVDAGEEARKADLLPIGKGRSNAS